MHKVMVRPTWLVMGPTKPEEERQPHGTAWSVSGNHSYKSFTNPTR
jgi:hypothetical protein